MMDGRDEVGWEHRIRMGVIRQDGYVRCISHIFGGYLWGLSLGGLCLGDEIAEMRDSMTDNMLEVVANYLSAIMSIFCCLTIIVVCSFYTISIIIC